MRLEHTTYPECFETVVWYKGQRVMKYFHSYRQDDSRNYSLLNPDGSIKYWYDEKGMRHSNISKEEYYRRLKEYENMN